MTSQWDWATEHGRGEEVESASHNNFFKQFKEVSGLHTLFVWVLS